MALNRKQLAFCKEYVIDKNSARAAIDAGYSKRTARTIGSKLLTKIDVANEVDRLMAIAADKAMLSAVNIIKSIQDTIARCSKEGSEFDPANVLRGNELLGRNMKMWTDKLEVSSSEYAKMSDDELQRQLASTEQEDKSINDDVDSVH